MERTFNGLALQLDQRACGGIGGTSTSCWALELVLRVAAARRRRLRVVRLEDDGGNQVSNMWVGVAAVLLPTFLPR